MRDQSRSSWGGPLRSALSHTIAFAMVHGAEAGLERLESIAKDPRLDGHHRVTAVKAHLLERSGDREGAIDAYVRAAQQTASEAEREYLLTRAASLRER